MLSELMRGRTMHIAPNRCSMNLASLPTAWATLAVCAVLLSLPVASSARTGAQQATSLAPSGVETLELLTLPVDDFEVPRDIAQTVRLSDGLLWLPPSKGWFMAPRLHDDLLVRLRFKPVPGAAVGVLLRAYLNGPRTRVQRGYEVWLPPPDEGDGRLVVVQRGERSMHQFAKQAAKHDVPWAGAWHSLVIEAQQGRSSSSLTRFECFLAKKLSRCPGRSACASPVARWSGVRCTSGRARNQRAFQTCRELARMASPRRRSETR